MMNSKPHVEDFDDDEDIPFGLEEDSILDDLKAETYRADQLEEEVQRLEGEIADLSAQDLARVERLTKLEKRVRRVLRDIRKEIMNY
jgi:hypothetical protein